MSGVQRPTDIIARVKDLLARVAKLESRSGGVSAGGGVGTTPTHAALPDVAPSQHHSPANDHARDHSVTGSTHTFPGGTVNFLRADGTFAAPPGGASITIQEVDGTPSGTPSTLQFPNGTITDHGGGVYEYVPASSGGRYSLAVTTQSGDYTVLSTDDLVLMSGSGKTATLPTAVGITGRPFYIKNTGTGLVTIATTSAQTIDGVTTQTLAPQWALTVCSDGSNWQAI
jgi:hypothetical protein